MALSARPAVSLVALCLLLLGACRIVETESPAPAPGPAPADPGAPPEGPPHGDAEPGELPTGATSCAAVLCLEGTQCIERDGRAECVPAGPADCAAVRCAPGTECVERDGRVECVPPTTSACAAVLCAENTRCVERGGQAECVPIEAADRPCIRTGCSGQICSDRDVASTCEYRDEYACYRDATCERQADGSCGWTPTPELESCLSR